MATVLLRVRNGGRGHSGSGVGTGDCGVGLVIDSSFLNGEQLGAGVAELVAERDGLLEGDGDPAGFPDDDGVEGGVGRRGHRHELFELVSSPGWIGVYCRDGDLVGGAVFAAGGFLVFFWNEAVARSWRVLDVDGSLGHGAEVQEVESGGRAASAGVVAVCCLSVAGRLASMIAQRRMRTQGAAVISHGGGCGSQPSWRRGREWSGFSGVRR